ncbi:GNAT family N-acetyltransferase [Alteromonas sp. a30]|uniref:GNAT family N-acetyltransferase n=1 Tax=Alteromonas sp. a30 TaxID=2730917 RepID=UPI002282C6CD|nr:GNAT family N-acetyltransferase [Alteromonas sp. a30]MCY7297310.1 N-acetyltransferase [Alteromonas sp. a30]
MALEIKFIKHLSQIPAYQWQALVDSDQPFIQYAFLLHLETSGAVNNPDTGWFAHHLCVFEQDELVAALPLYKKTSWFGEYVFDWAWDEAYARYGFEYYPKLTAAIPFTPVTGPRILSQKPITPELLKAITQSIEKECQDKHFSSCHILFPEPDISKQLHELNWKQRNSIQFHWFNQNYQNFEQFLMTFTSRKRKNVKKERQKVQEAGIKIVRITGSELEPKHLAFFYRCYQQTYAKRSGHIGYFNLDFFTGSLDICKDNLLLVIAVQDSTAVASALYFYDNDNLYGRYWGSLVEIDALHFECCYYQGIEFCIEKNIKRFNPGTQGEHKIQRGFKPIYCYSNHWLKDPLFHNAIVPFLEEESIHINEYKQQMSDLLPFKKE